MHCRLAISTHTYFISLHFRISKCDMGERKGGRTEKINTKQKPWRPFAWLGGRLFGLWCLGAGRILQGEQLGCGGGGSPFFLKKNYYLLADCSFLSLPLGFFRSEYSLDIRGRRGYLNINTILSPRFQLLLCYLLVLRLGLRLRLCGRSLRRGRGLRGGHYVGVFL